MKITMHTDPQSTHKDKSCSFLTRPCNGLIRACSATRASSQSGSKRGREQSFTSLSPDRMIAQSVIQEDRHLSSLHPCGRVPFTSRLGLTRRLPTAAAFLMKNSSVVPVGRRCRKLFGMLH